MSSEISRFETVEEWEYNGRDCKVVWAQISSHFAHWNGYAKTDISGHYQDLQSKLRVNGGITSGVDEDGYIGFDCGHARDVCVRNGERYGYTFCLPEHAEVWTLEAVKEEVESLADQLEKIEDPVKAARRAYVEEDITEWEFERRLETAFEKTVENP